MIISNLIIVLSLFLAINFDPDPIVKLSTNLDEDQHSRGALKTIFKNV